MTNEPNPPVNSTGCQCGTVIIAAGETVECDECGMDVFCGTQDTRVSFADGRVKTPDGDYEIANISDVEITIDDQTDKLRGPGTYIYDTEHSFSCEFTADKDTSLPSKPDWSVSFEPELFRYEEKDD